VNVLLKGVVGSTAYGLAHEGSDIDKIGIFAENTRDLFLLTPPKDTVTTTDPDLTMHEAAKAVKLLLNCNPTLNEILWLPEYEECTYLGQQLVNIRQCFLSDDRVRNAYLGYATQQFRRFVSKGKFNSDISPQRASKHARHLYRLVLQGHELLTTGKLTVRLENPDECREFGEYAVANPEFAKLWLDGWKGEYEAPSVLPRESKLQPVQHWINIVRGYYYEERA
jgi:uncharacterized protein